MREIIPGLPDISDTIHTSHYIALNELVVDRKEGDTQKLLQFIGNYVDGLLNMEMSRFIDGCREKNAGIFTNFLCVPIAMGSIKTVRDFLMRFQELSQPFQSLILSHISSITELSHMERFIDFVFIVSELQRLEKEFPNQLTPKDYEFAHQGWSDGFYRNVAHLRARLQGNVLF